MHKFKVFFTLLFFIMSGALFAQSSIDSSPSISYIPTESLLNKSKEEDTEANVTKVKDKKNITPGASALGQSSAKTQAKLKTAKLKPVAPGHSSLARGRYLRSSKLKKKKQ